MFVELRRLVLNIGACLAYYGTDGALLIRVLYSLVAVWHYAKFRAAAEACCVDSTADKPHEHERRSLSMQPGRTMLFDLSVNIARRPRSIEDQPPPNQGNPKPLNQPC